MNCKNIFIKPFKCYSLHIRFGTYSFELTDRNPNILAQKKCLITNQIQRTKFDTKLVPKIWGH